MKITAIRRHRTSPEKVNVYVDGVLRFSASEEEARARGLRVGADIEVDQIEAMQAASAPARAREFALKLLAARPRSAHQIRTRLRSRGFSPEVVEACLIDLVRARLVDDAEYARAFVRSRIRHRPRGPRLLVAEMGARGIDGATAREAVEAACEDEGVTELDLARQAAAKRVRRRGEDARRTEQRIRAFLARKGFSQGTARQIVQEIRAGADPQ